MAHRALTQINSGFGTFAAGHELPADLPPGVLDAWTEAGIAEPVSELAPEPDAPADPPAAKPIEIATAPAPEKAVAPRQRTPAAPKAKPTAPKAKAAK